MFSSFSIVEAKQKMWSTFAGFVGSKSWRFNYPFLLTWHHSLQLLLLQSLSLCMFLCSLGFNSHFIHFAQANSHLLFPFFFLIFSFSLTTQRSDRTDSNGHSTRLVIYLWVVGAYENAINFFLRKKQPLCQLMQKTK